MKANWLSSAVASEADTSISRYSCCFIKWTADCRWYQIVSWQHLLPIFLFRLLQTPKTFSILINVLIRERQLGPVIGLHFHWALHHRAVITVLCGVPKVLVRHPHGRLMVHWDPWWVWTDTMLGPYCHRNQLAACHDKSPLWPLPYNPIYHPQMSDNRFRTPHNAAIHNCHCLIHIHSPLFGHLASSLLLVNFSVPSLKDHIVGSQYINMTISFWDLFRWVSSGHL